MRIKLLESGNSNVPILLYDNSVYITLCVMGPIVKYTDAHYILGTQSWNVKSKKIFSSWFYSNIVYPFVPG